MAHLDESGRLRFSCELADRKDIPAILELQQANLASNLPAEACRKEGCVGIETSVELLGKLISLQLVIVARLDKEIIAHLIAAPISYTQELPLLLPLSTKIPHLRYSGRPIADFSLLLGVQIVIARAFRGQGVVEALYRKVRQKFGKRYRLFLSEISEDNSRSLHVHLNKIGWVAIDRYIKTGLAQEGNKWVVILYDLQNNP